MQDHQIIINLLYRNILQKIGINRFDDLNIVISDVDTMQRMELLGDKLLSLLIVEKILQIDSKMREGTITKMVSYLASNDTVSKYITYMTKPNRLDINTKSKADLFEVILAHIYNLYGIMKCRVLIEAYIDLMILDYSESKANPKGLIQERLCDYNSTPMYIDRFVYISGYKIYITSLIFYARNFRHVIFGMGKSIKAAHHMAAYKAINRLDSIGRLTGSAYKIIVMRCAGIHGLKSKETDLIFVRHSCISPTIFTRGRQVWNYREIIGMVGEIWVVH